MHGAIERHATRADNGMLVERIRGPHGELDATYRMPPGAAELKTILRGQLVALPSEELGATL